MPELFRLLAAELERAPENLVPPAYTSLWERPRFSVWYGGRGAAKSWSISRVLLMQSHDQPLRVLCCREIQGSIRESAYRLLSDQINMLQLDDFFDVQADSIIGSNGSRFFFEGLRYNASKIRSYEGVDVVWVEEAQSVSELSWETLLPTIRKPGSRFYISFNPMTRDEPVSKRFVENTPPNSIVHKVSYRDNPFLSPEAEAERAWLEKTDPDAYRHVWEGFPRTVSDALILRGKFVAEQFEVSASWAGPYHGLDYGFSRDPSAGLRCYIDDETRILYVSHEFWQLGADIDALPGMLEAAIPGISRHVVFCDSARPESTSYLVRNGIPNARSAEKWPGSLDDGIAYLRAFSRIVIDPNCKHLLDECGTYSFKSDRLTGAPLPEPEDKNNHLVDALRYALSPLIRNLPVGGYFSRTALLVDGEPVTSFADRPLRVFATLAVCERPGTALGLVYWLLSPHHSQYLVVLDYELVEVGDLLNVEWLEQVFERAQELRAHWDAVDMVTRVWIEEGDLYEASVGTFTSHLLQSEQVAAGERPLYDLGKIKSESLPLGGLDQRAAEIRATVNVGKFVKLGHEAYARQVTHRSVTANHLISQLLGYRPGARDTAQELTSAFALGCLIARGGERPVAAATVSATPEPEPHQALEAPHNWHRGFPMN